MANNKQSSASPPQDPREPRGFSEHTRGLPGEYAHEQGWGLEAEERTRQDASTSDTDGGNDYNYSARDFGDEPVNMKRVGSDPAAEEAARRALDLDQSTRKEKS
jgi:hypothetical protein